MKKSRSRRREFSRSFVDLTEKCWSDVKSRERQSVRRVRQMRQKSSLWTKKWEYNDFENESEDEWKRMKEWNEIQKKKLFDLIVVIKLSIFAFISLKIEKISKIKTRTSFETTMKKKFVDEKSDAIKVEIVDEFIIALLVVRKSISSRFMSCSRLAIVDVDVLFVVFELVFVDVSNLTRDAFASKMTTRVSFVDVLSVYVLFVDMTLIDVTTIDVLREIVLVIEFSRLNFFSWIFVFFARTMRVNLSLSRVLKTINVWFSLMLINSILRFLRRTSWWIIIFIRIVIFWFWTFIWINTSCLNSFFELKMNVILCVSFRDVAFWSDFMIKDIAFWSVFTMKIKTDVFWILDVVWATTKWFSSLFTLLNESWILKLMINDLLSFLDDL